MQPRRGRRRPPPEKGTAAIRTPEGDFPVGSQVAYTSGRPLPGVDPFTELRITAVHKDGRHVDLRVVSTGALHKRVAVSNLTRVTG